MKMATTVRKVAATPAITPILNLVQSISLVYSARLKLCADHPKLHSIRRSPSRIIAAKSATIATMPTTITIKILRQLHDMPNLLTARSASPTPSYVRPPSPSRTPVRFIRHLLDLNLFKDGDGLCLFPAPGE